MDQKITTLNIPCCLLLAVTDVDPDYVRLDISMADGTFSGRVDVYERPGLAAALAAELHGFPRSPTDRREVVLGSFDPAVAGGGLRPVFRCLDRSGHAIVEADLEDQPMDGNAPRFARLRMPVDATAIDSFVADLSGWSAMVGGGVILRGVAQ